MGCGMVYGKEGKMRILGGLMVAVPFITVAALIWHERGWKEVAIAFGGAALIVVMVIGGIILFTR